MWYTLKSIPRFNPDGLWFHDDVGFSCAGSLTASLVALVEHSPCGLSAEALAGKFHCRCHSILVGLVRQGRLTREKRGRSFVYLAADPAASGKQRQHAALARQPAPPSLSAEMAVLALVEFIMSPDATFSDLAKTISRRCHAVVDAAQIEQLFTKHGLKKKPST